ncbi:MAG: hypothetical protein Q4E86_07240 [Lachnospiraceae bacterium]|nr:hypothetical protein [Lachnospiraceae bacterium]
MMGRMMEPAAVWLKKRITFHHGGRWKREGSTMVEVIISFAMLVIVAAMFSNVFLLCSRMTLQATALMEENARFCEDYYLKENLQTELIREGRILFERIDDNQKKEDGDFFFVEEMELYRHTSTEGWRGKLYDVSDGE